MQNFRAKQAVLFVVFKAKAVYNSSQSQWNVLNLFFTCNLTFNTTEQSFPTLLAVMWHLSKMSRMDDEIPVFEQLNLSDFKMCSSTVLKTFNNYNIIITNISHKNKWGWSGEFHAAFEHFQDFKNLNLNILKEKLTTISYNLKIVYSFLSYSYWRAEKWPQSNCDGMGHKFWKISASLRPSHFLLLLYWTFCNLTNKFFI